MAYIALENAVNGELVDIVAETGPLPKTVTRYYMCQLLDALEYIHKSGISHRCLKVTDLLLDEEYNLKLSGFEFAGKKAMENELQIHHMSAPEVHHNVTQSDVYTDLFAFGVILFTLHTGRAPYYLASDSDPHYRFLIQNLMSCFFSKHG